MVAALEARRNEDEVLAEGALLGERRVAWARLAMIGMFGVIASSQSGYPPMIAVGAAYAAYSVVTLWRLERVRPSAARARWLPLLIATVDYAFSTIQGVLDHVRGNPFSLGRPAIGVAIVMSFAIARSPFFHVVYSVMLGLICFTVTAAVNGALGDGTTLFCLGGLVVFGIMIGMTNIAVRRMFGELRKRDNLTRFLPRQVAERVIAHGASALAPVEREVTVLFSDIRGFTGLSEGMGPREVLLMLDDYFGRMSQIVKGHDGVVGKFLGDGMLAFWGVPDLDEQHAARAVRAARDMREAVRQLNLERERDGTAPLRIGIGIHTGPVAAGMLGGELQAEYTIIGDAVNVASRIEGLTKEHGVDVLVSETTWVLASPQGERVGAAEIRGRKEPVVLYRLS